MQPRRRRNRQPPNPDSHYQLGPDSLPREGVPKGEVRGPFTLPSQAYPGTQHTYWVYVPAQYDPAVPASLMIFNDGQAFKNMEGDRPRAERARQPDLPARDPGDARRVHQPRPHGPSSPSRRRRSGATATTNRPTEYNTLDDKYARVIVDELMPALAQGVQHLERSRAARHRRRELRRDRRLHRGLGAARTISARC